jgi:hypothetical protein
LTRGVLSNNIPHRKEKEIWKIILHLE